MQHAGGFRLSKRLLTGWRTGKQIPLPGAAKILRISGHENRGIHDFPGKALRTRKINRPGIPNRREDGWESPPLRAGFPPNERAGADTGPVARPESVVSAPSPANTAGLTRAHAPTGLPLNVSRRQRMNPPACRHALHARSETAPGISPPRKAREQAPALARTPAGRRAKFIILKQNSSNLQTLAG